MLTRLSIRDIVLIDRLDIDFAAGLAVLTGETGAGKSILLDAFALALGARGDAALVRQGAEQGQVTAVFDVPPRHPARALLEANDIAAEDELILRRVQFADGRTRAFVNDQPVSVQVLKSLGAVAGRNPRPARRSRAGRCRDPSRACSMLSAGWKTTPDEVARLWAGARRARGGRGRIAPRSSARSARPIICATRSRNCASSRPSRARKPRLPTRRTAMMQAEKVADDLRDAHEAVAGSDSPVPGASRPRCAGWSAARRRRRR